MFALGGSTSWLCWIVGGVTVLNGLFNALVILTHPTFRTGELSVGDEPWARAKKAEEEVGAYLRARPDLIMKAVGVVGTAAAATAASQPGFGGIDSPISNPYAMVLANQQQQSGPGRGPEPSPAPAPGYYDSAGQLGPNGYGVVVSAIPQGASYSEASAVRHGYLPGLPVGGAAPAAPYRQGAIRVQTITQSVTSTVVEYAGPHPPPPHIMGGHAVGGNLYDAGGTLVGGNGGYFPGQNGPMFPTGQQQPQPQHAPLPGMPGFAYGGGGAGFGGAPFGQAQQQQHLPPPLPPPPVQSWQAQWPATQQPGIPPPGPGGAAGGGRNAYTDNPFT